MVSYGSTCVCTEADDSSLLDGMDLCCSYHIQPKQNIYTNTRIDVVHNMLSDITRCWHANRRVFESWHSPWDLLVSTFGCFSSNITWYYSFWILLNITISCPVQMAHYYTILHNITQYYSILLNITNMTQYYLLTWSWRDPKLFESFLQAARVWSPRLP